MFQNSESEVVKFINQINGSVDIEKIIIRDFLSVNLVEHRFQISVEIALLMRVLTITKLFLAIYRATESRTFACIKIIEDRWIIVGRNGKRFFCHPTTFFEWGSGTVLHQHVQQRFVLSLRSNDNYIVVVLGCGTNQRDSAYIDFLNNICFGCTGSYSSFKRIQVNND